MDTPGPKTHFRGKDPIDGIWITPDLDVLGASYLPFHADIGDHWPVVADISLTSIIGQEMKQIVPEKSHHLNSKIGQVRDRYNQKLEAQF